MKLKFVFRVAIAVIFSAFLVQTPVQALTFSASGSGSLVIVPTSPTLLEETITINFPTATPFPLDTGVFQTGIDPSITPITDALFNSRFRMSSRSEDAAFGIYRLQSSRFLDDVEELFSGLFTFTGGEGNYAGVSGGGTFSGTNIYDDANHLSGVSSLTATGSLTLTAIPEPATVTLIALGMAAIFVRRFRMREPVAIA
jgi:hypothetical protein